MSFAPVIPVSGYAGWRFLNRTIDSQKAAFDKTPALENNAAYFRENIGKIKSAEALVADRRLLTVALGAFGLGDDIDNKFFIRKVLTDGSLKDDALANRIADKRYLKLSEAFGFGDFALPNTQLSDFPDKIIDAYKTHSFEVAVGVQNADMRLALNLSRELSELAVKDSSDDTKWFTIMGSEPLRQVFETAMGFPASFAALDIDRQLDMFRDRARQMFGAEDVAQFADPAMQDKLVRLFLVRSELNGFNPSLAAANTALTLLQSAGR